MPDESAESQPQSPPKRSHQYPKQRKSAKPEQPIAPNPAVIAMESELLPLMKQRMDANNAVRSATMAVNQANRQLDEAREYLQQIEGEVNYRLQVIAQIKGVPLQIQNPNPQNLYIDPSDPSGSRRRFADYPAQPPSPMYNPVTPYPQFPPPAQGIGSWPAPNKGLYPDATDRTESAEDIRRMEEEGGYGRIR